jgi:hypothetical protein
MQARTLLHPSSVAAAERASPRGSKTTLLRCALAAMLATLLLAFAAHGARARSLLALHAPRTTVRAQVTFRQQLATDTLIICPGGATGTCEATAQGLTITVLHYAFDANVEGRISGAVGLLTSLTRLDLSNMPGLTGPLPDELSLLTNLRTLFLHNSQLSGGIPHTLTGLVLGGT